MNLDSHFNNIEPETTFDLPHSSSGSSASDMKVGGFAFYPNIIGGFVLTVAM
jgi:hypothetical protein